MPCMALIFSVLMPRLLNSHSPQIMGEVAVIDPTSMITPELQRTLTPEAIAKRRGIDAARNPAPQTAAPAARAAAAPQGPPIPMLTVVPLPANTDVEDKKSWLIQPRNASPAHLALVVMQPDAVTQRANTKSFGSFDLYTSTHLDDATETALRESIRAALITARLPAADSIRPPSPPSNRWCSRIRWSYQPGAITPAPAASRAFYRSPAAFCCSSAS